MLKAGFYNMDCMVGMKEFPDKFFDLAIVDPPYGGGGVPIQKNRTTHCAEDLRTTSGAQGQDSAEQVEGLAATISVNRAGGWVKKYQKGGLFSDADIRHWDYAPPPEYFAELSRVSKDQIIWGGNYFDLPPTRCFLIWRKLGMPEQMSFAMCEYAWTSFNKNAKCIEIRANGPPNSGRFHPTQKPVQLYTWILNNYAKNGDKILDTHAGSASSLVACHKLGFECWGFEIDAEYYRMASDRLERFKAQGSLLDLMSDD